MMSLRTTLENFLNHAETLEERRQEGDDLYEKEFQLLKTLSESLRCLPQYSCNYGERDCNRRKNRYKDIVPYDYTRVILTSISGDPEGDYINANYIKGASGSMAYIASQGPLPHTVEDFWRMIWECEVQVVVMASSEMEGGKHKCERYWAYDDEERQFGRISVKLVRLKKVCPDFVVRTMRARCDDEERTIIQFHYVTWPDHGIPHSVAPILNMARLVRDCQSSETVPVLVHCSAGCGRTGTVCAIDYVWGLLRSGKLTENFSLFKLISDMRKQRIAMVQTKEQYILVHRAVQELFEQHLKVIDSHHYENVEFKGVPTTGIKTEEVDYEFIDDDDGRDATSKALDIKRRAMDAEVDEIVRKCRETIAAETPPVPPQPLPKKNKHTLPSADKEGSSESESCESQVRHLISTWNHGQPQPVLNDDDDDIPEKGEPVPKRPGELVFAQQTVKADADESRNCDVRSASGDSVLVLNCEPSPGEKAVVIRKPSIAKLRAIFEKNTDSGSPTSSDNSDVPFPRHKNKKSVASPDGAEPALKPTFSKRSRSPFKRATSDNPEMKKVSTRYKDTALKVYSELRQHDQPIEDDVPPSPNSVLPEPSPQSERRPSPTMPELLRRVSSRRGSSGRTTSIWYDKDTPAPNGDETPSQSKVDDKPALPVKRSKSMKVQSITENAFGRFRLPSPNRPRKGTVAAYLSVEEERNSRESSPASTSSKSDALPSISRSDELGSVAHQAKQPPPKVKSSSSEDNCRLAADKPAVSIEQMTRSPRIFKRFLPKAAASSEKEPHEHREKPKSRYYFGESEPDVLPSSKNEPVQLLLVRSTADEVPLCPAAGTDVGAAGCELVKSPSGHSVHEPGVQLKREGQPAASKLFPSQPDLSPAVGESTPIFAKLPSNVVPSDENNAAKCSPVLTNKHYVNVIMSDDVPPPLPVKKNSPLNSPHVRRHAEEMRSIAEVHEAKCPPTESKSEFPPLTLETVVPICEFPPRSPMSESQRDSPPKEIENESPVATEHAATEDDTTPVEPPTDGVDKSNDQGKNGAVPAEEDEGYQQIIRDCQEYLLSSGYTNVFPEMSRNLKIIEESLQNHPRGGFVDLLSSTKEEAASNSGNANDECVDACEDEEIATEVDGSDLLACGVAESPDRTEAASEQVVSQKDGETDTAVATLAEQIESSEVAIPSNQEEGDVDKRADAVVNCHIDNSQTQHLTVKSHIEAKLEKTENKNESPDPAVGLTKCVPRRPPPPEHASIYANVTIQPANTKTEYEHLWLSQSGNAPILVQDDSSPEERTRSVDLKPSPAARKAHAAAEQTPPTTPVRRGSLGGGSSKSEYPRLSSETNSSDRSRAASSSPQLSRIPVRCKRVSSKKGTRDGGEQKGPRSFAPGENAPSERQQLGIADLAAPKLLKDVAATGNLSSSATSDTWQLSSYKMVKEAMRNTPSPVKKDSDVFFPAAERCEKDAEDEPAFTQAVKELETLSEVIEQLDCRNGETPPVKPEPPVKPARSYDGKPRKPLPLPRSILPRKVEVATERVPLAKQHSREESRSQAIKCKDRVTNSDSRSGKTPTVANSESGGGGLPRPGSDDSAASSNRRAACREDKGAENHEYEELDISVLSPTPKVENEYEEICFTELLPRREEKLIDLARLATGSTGGDLPTFENGYEEITLEDELGAPDASEVVTGLLLLPAVRKPESAPREDELSPSNHVYETVGGGRRVLKDDADPGKISVVHLPLQLSRSHFDDSRTEDGRPFYRKRNSLKRNSKDPRRKNSVELPGSDNGNGNAVVATVMLHDGATGERTELRSRFSQHQRGVRAETPDCLYSEVSKEKEQQGPSSSRRRCLVDSPSPHRHSSRYSKDDLELRPVAPPRIKRQSSASLRRNTVLDESSDPFWWTHTLPGRFYESSSAPTAPKPVEQWDEEWNSDEDCQPPVPAKTREAYMLPTADGGPKSPSASSDTASTGHPDSAGGKNKSKFSLFSKLGLKSDAKGGAAAETPAALAPSARPQARSAATLQARARPGSRTTLAPGIGFPHRLPKKPRGPREMPANWLLAATANPST